MVNKFNIRVYGIALKDNNLLLCDEVINGHKMTKFIGGGLELGEGTIECLKREFKEETGKEINVLNHFYTTDFFQISAFNPNHQIISVYYRVEVLDENFPFSNVPNHENDIYFRWAEMDKLTENDATFPIDRRVFNMIKVKLFK